MYLYYSKNIIMNLIFLINIHNLNGIFNNNYIDYNIHIHINNSI